MILLNAQAVQVKFENDEAEMDKGLQMYLYRSLLHSIECFLILWRDEVFARWRQIILQSLLSRQSISRVIFEYIFP